MAAATGVIVPADMFRPDDLVTHVRRLEELGYKTAWITDMFGRHIYVTAAHLLANTERIRIGTGVAHIYGRDAVDAAQAARTLTELSGGRFVQGLGVSHPVAAEMRGLAWEPPVAKSRDYLAAIRGELPLSTPDEPPTPLYLAAHGPKMLAVAAEHADGAMSYMQTPDGCASARAILGPDKHLNVVVPSCITTDADVGRAMGRRALAMYLPLPAYHRVWRRDGFDESDWAAPGSDRFIDEYYNWGASADVVRRMEALLEAGATDIIVGASPNDPADPASIWSTLEALAPA
ncbi:MAG: LLM class flavin-dependent oxidoreductase [Actinomycetota bacterium]